MRIRIVHKPSEACIDGLRLDKFLVGHQYEVGNMLGAVFLAEGWAEPIDDSSPSPVIPLPELESGASVPSPANLIRDTSPPYFDEPIAVALDRRRRSRRRAK